MLYAYLKFSDVNQPYHADPANFTVYRRQFGSPVSLQLHPRSKTLNNAMCFEDLEVLIMVLQNVTCAIVEI